MKSDVRNALSADRRVTSLEATVADTIAAVAELAQQSRRVVAPAAASTAAEANPRGMRDSMRSAELPKPSQHAATPVTISTAAERRPPGMRDSVPSAELRRAAAPPATSNTARGSPV